MHDVAVTPAVHCRVQFRLLPENCRPAYVVRHRGVTLVAVDPRSTRQEAADWAAAHLSTQEREILRRAYGQPPVGQPLPIAEREFPVLAVIPRSLRLSPRQFRDLELDGALI